MTALWLTQTFQRCVWLVRSTCLPGSETLHVHTLSPSLLNPSLQIDPSVPITSVGVDKFVLVQRGAGSDLATTPRCGDPSGAGGGGSEADVILLRVTIPQASIALRACEVGSGAAPSLTLTCYAPKDSGASSSFSVQLTGGGSAKPLAGLAAPSEQSQAALSAALAAALQGPP